MLSLYSSHLQSRTIWLASNSPRRQKLLQQMGLSFKVVPSDFAENLDPRKFPSSHDFVMENAKQKALDVLRSIKEKVYEKDLPHLIIAADTVVVLGNEIIGKPRSEKHNINILERLGGRTHLVLTGIALIVRDEQNKNDPSPHVKTFFETTSVHMMHLTKEVIEAYVKTGEPADKAGGYAIQGLASTLVRGITGDYFNVVGLPVCKLAKEIHSLCEAGLL